MGFALVDRSAAALRHEGQFGDRHAGSLMTNVFRLALIKTDELRRLCLVRSLSTRGMVAKVYSPVTAGTAIEMEFAEHISVTGTVSWSEHRLIGVHFDDHANVAELLADARRRVLRNTVDHALQLEFNAPGEIEADGCRKRIEITELSQRGIKANVASYQLVQGDEVLIKLHGFEPRSAVVRWNLAGTAGLHFLEPFSLDELAEWLVGLQGS